MVLELLPFLAAWLVSLAVAMWGIPRWAAVRSVERWVARFAGDAGGKLLKEILEPVITPILDEWWEDRRKELLVDMEDTIKILVPQIISGAMGRYSKQVAVEHPELAAAALDMQDAPWWQKAGMKVVIDRIQGSMLGGGGGTVPHGKGSRGPAKGKSGVDGAGL